MFEGYMEFLYFGVGIMILSTALKIKIHPNLNKNMNNFKSL